MDWGVKPVSRGTDPESYTIQLPLFLSEIGRFMEMDGVEGNIVQFTLGGRTATVERKDHFYVVRVGGFNTQVEAEAFLRRVAVALFLLTIRQKSGLHFDPDLEPVEIEANRPIRDMFPPEMYGNWGKREDGTYTDGGIWPMSTTIYPEHQRIVEYKMLWGRKVDDLKTKYISETFDLAADYFDPEAVIGDQRLCLALRLYASAQRHPDARARFVSLVTVLEILGGERRHVSASVLDVIEELAKIVRGARDRHSKSSSCGGHVYGELDRLLSGVGELRKKSISVSVRDYVYEKLYADGCPVSGVEEIPREVSDERMKEIYAVRSSLVHAGVVEGRKGKTGDDRFSTSFNDLHLLLPQLLLAELAAHAVPGKLPIPESVTWRDYG